MNEINICKEVGAKIRYFRKLQGGLLMLRADAALRASVTQRLEENLNRL